MYLFSDESESETGKTRSGNVEEKQSWMGNQTSNTSRKVVGATSGEGAFVVTFPDCKPSATPRRSISIRLICTSGVLVLGSQSDMNVRAGVRLCVFLRGQTMRIGLCASCR